MFVEKVGGRTPINQLIDLTQRISHLVPSIDNSKVCKEGKLALFILLIETTKTLSSTVKYADIQKDVQCVNTIVRGTFS